MVRDQCPVTRESAGVNKRKEDCYEKNIGQTGVSVLRSNFSLWALAGCNNIFTVTLDKESYTAGDNGTATLGNKGPVTAYLPGCSQFSYEKLVDGTWTDQGPAVVCVWEGNVVPVAAGARTSRRLPQKMPVPGGSGTWLRSAALKVNP